MITFLSKKLLAIICLIALLSACANHNQVIDANDPLENINRATFKFNTTVDKYTLKPVAKGYKKVVPSLARRGLSNAFENINGVTIFAHDTLQLKPKDAITTLHRFVFNTVFGLGGLIDLTSTFHLPPAHNNDFGMTFAHYGWKDSSFIVIPLLGPSTVRDGLGAVGDIYLDLVHYTDISNSVNIVDLVNHRAKFLDLENIQDNSALDNYIFQREAYKGIRNNILFEAGILTEEEAQNLQTKQSNEEDDDEDSLSIQELAKKKRQQNIE